MASIRKTITDRVKTTLAGAGKPANVAAVQKSRFHPVQLDTDGQAVIQIYLATDTPVEDATGQADMTLRIRVATQVRAPAGTSTDDALDPFLVWVHQALLQDEVLNAGADAIASQVSVPKTTWYDGEEQERDASFGAAVQEFEIEYQTAYNDPEATG